MADPVFVEHLRHLFGDHVAVVRDGNERDFFSHFGHGSGSRSFGTLGWIFWRVTHGQSIHQGEGEKGSYSKASREERSGNVFWHAVQVRK